MARGKKFRDKSQLLNDINKEKDNKFIEENKEIVPLVRQWKEDSTLLEKRLDELKSKVDKYGQAQEIIDSKNSILEDAEKRKKETEDEIVENKKTIQGLQEKISKMEKLMGVYSDATEIINAAKKEADIISKRTESENQEKIKNATEKAESIIKNANIIKEQSDNHLNDINIESDKIINEAKETSSRIIKEARERYDQTILEKDELLNNAKTSAASIKQEALDKIKQYYDCKEAEGESLKTVIVDKAQSEKENIIEQAKITAASIANQVRESADDYAIHKREMAEKEAQSIVARANKQSDDVIMNIDKIKEQAIKDTENARKKLDDEILNTMQKSEELDAQLLQARLENERLAEREKNLNQIIKDEVDRECQEIIDDRERIIAKGKKIYEQLKDLKKFKEAKNDEKNEYLLKDRDELEKAKEKLSVFENLGITADNAEEFCLAMTNIKELEKKNKKLLADRDKYKELSDSRVNQENELNEEKDKTKRYKEEIAELVDKISNDKKVDRNEMLSSIRKMPTDWNVETLEKDKFLTEKEWLKNIKDKAFECRGLKFSSRLINAFHTAQKINDISSLVVLAGISGTGKSELPKNYAIYGGMNFISVPVKPDWDSPASLFGYFNSIERQFEASELIRAIYQMNNEYREQMMMVLLDEMNLAHPEQYFADLLSKLETCRGTGKNATYDIILGAGESPEPLEIGRNILWTGTMNEDETTKGLSDKVIDRSTLITFPRPTELYDKIEKEEMKQEFVITRKLWEKWRSNKRTDITDKLNLYKKDIEEINRHMSSMGRNLGHRVWQGISEYMCNHPVVISAKTEAETNEALMSAFIDAIVFKVMPKLRGVETQGKNDISLQQIENILKNRSVEVAKDFHNARDLNTELFQWCTSDFMIEKEDTNE